MIKNIIDKLFKKNQRNEENYVYINIQVNDKIMPVDRGDYYEDHIEIFLNKNNYGEICGSGTMQNKNGEIEFCDIEICVYEKLAVEKVIEKLKEELIKLEVPKGSKIFVDEINYEEEVGIKEGIAIYLDGKNLHESIYKECDVNFVISEISKLVKDEGNIIRYWEGEEETGLYFYGERFEEMKENIKSFLDEYPLCKGARGVRIA